MELRLVFILLFLFSLHVNAIEQEGDTVVESTPVDVFTDRSGLWHSEKLSSEKTHYESMNPFESLNKTPGVQSRFEGSPTLSIRGSQSLPRVLGMYNGIPLNGASGFGPNRLLIPQETVGETRIFKGPASVFFGSDAMGGAINFLTRRYTGPTVRGNVGSFGQQGLFGALPFAKSENSYHHVTSFSEGYDGGYPYEWASSGVKGTRSATNRSLQRHTFFGEQKTGRFSFGENLLWSQEIGTSPGAVNLPEATHGRSSNGLASFSTNYIAASDLEFSHRVYGIKSDSEYRDSYGETSTTNSTVGNAVSVRKKWSPGIASDFFADNKYDDFKNTYSGNQYYTSNDTEIGTTLDYSLSDVMVLKPGTRYLATYKTFVSAIGLFEEHEMLKKWLTYSEGFHAPSLIQRYATNSFSLANPDLKPETSSQVEIGFDQGFEWDSNKPWNKAGISLNVFSIQYKNFITNETVTGSQKRPVNTDSASGYGVEGKASATYEVYKVGAGYSYLKAEDNAHNPLPLSPENQYQLSAGMNWAVLYAELVHTIWDKFYDRSGTTLKTLNSWNTTDLNIESVNINDWKIKFSALNLFDNPVELTYGYPDPQRRFLMSVEKVF